MADLDQVITQIRFGIEQLGSQNAFHPFERLCRHLARARICSNILPATGPVSAGGDQGRDFETFRTYLAKSALRDSSFMGLASEGPIAFACSLQDKATIVGKIRDDIKVITSSGSPVGAIHYFAGADIPVAKRHELQAKVKADHSVHLEIYDGQAIAEMLADREVFWIAEKYLGIPAELFPPIQSADWYTLHIEKWQKTEPKKNNFSDFEEIRLAGRHAFTTDGLRQNLRFWIDLIKKHYLESEFDELRLRAVYEASVLSLRGFNDLEGFEPHLEWFFSKQDQMSLARLEDARALQQYCSIAAAKGILSISLEQIGKWENAWSSRLDVELSRPNISENQQSVLLKLKGWHAMYMNPWNPKFPNFEECVRLWLECILVARNARMFPLRQFASQLEQFLELMIEIGGIEAIPPSYFVLTAKVDELLAERVGGFSAAESSFRRANIFAKNGSLLGAIDAMHQAKIDWFATETLEKSLQMMLFVSKMYFDLGLLFAAKYYAYAVAFIAINQPNPDVKKLASRGLMRAATWDYVLGAFRNFLLTTKLEIPIHYSYAEDAGNFDDSSEIKSITYHLMMLKVLAEKLYPDFEPCVDEIINRLYTPDLIDETLPQFREALEGGTSAQISEFAAEQMSGRLFDDLHDNRQVAWKALGVTWKAEWKNTHAVTGQAEEFLAILQIFLGEIAQTDLCLLQTEVTLRIEISEISDPRGESIPSNEGREWKITLPAEGSTEGDLDKSHMEVFGIVCNILLEASLLQTDDFFAIAEGLFQKGLSARIFVGRPYHELYSQFIPIEQFHTFPGLKDGQIPADEVVQSEHAELGWFSGPGPTYSAEKTDEMLKNRYRRELPEFQLAVSLIGNTVDFRAIIEDLRARGWLDWQIMYVIANVAVNYQMNLRGRGLSLPEANKLFAQIRSGQIKWAPVPTEEFSYENLLISLRFSMQSTIQLLGLQSRQATPDFGAIDKFLRDRYNYWSDDVEHRDIIEEL